MNIELYVCYGSSGWMLEGKFNSVNQAVKHARVTADVGVKCQILIQKWDVSGKAI